MNHPTEIAAKAARNAYRELPEQYFEHDFEEIITPHIQSAIDEARLAKIKKWSALEFFRVVHGKGDAGSEQAFQAQNPELKKGWVRLAAYASIDLSRAAHASEQVDEAEGFRKALCKAIDFAEWGWTIIANAHGGDWEKESKDWQETAAKYRDQFHNDIRFLAGVPTPATASEQTIGDVVEQVADDMAEHASEQADPVIVGGRASCPKCGEDYSMADIHECKENPEKASERPLDAWPLLHEATKMLANYDSYDLEQRQDFYARVNLAESGKTLAHAPATSSEQGAEQLAITFHNIYERLAPDFGYETRKETRDFDPTTPNGRLMIAVCREILQYHLPRHPTPSTESEE